MTNTTKLKSNAERFIIAYNSIDYSLRSIYGFKRSISYADLIRKSVSLNSVIRKYEEELIDYGRLRNSIVHKTNPNYVIAEPHDEVVEEFEKIAKLIATPPTAFNKICNKEVVICDADITIREMLQIMARTGYHNVPVYKDNNLLGMAIGSNILQKLGDSLIEGNDITEYIQNTKAIEVIASGTDNVYFQVCGKNMTIEKALNSFYINRKLSAILITENGRTNEKPIGIITTADILDMNAVLENY